MSASPNATASTTAAATSASSLLRLEGVQTHIGAYHILHGVDFDVPAGGVTLLLGRNGAGKTTTLRTIMGLWATSQGTICLDGCDIARLPTPDRALKGIAYVPENMGIFADLSVRDNLVLAARGARFAEQLDKARLARIVAAFPALERFWDKPAGLLSGGQKQMLAVARAMIEPRRLLLIDEPSKGLAPAIVQNLIDALRVLKADGTTILLVEQNFQFARQIGDTVAVMDDGRIVHRGTVLELVNDQALQQRLLGLSLGAHQ